MRDILSELYLNKQVDDCIAKIVPRQHREDFKQELFVILLEKESQIVSDIYEQGKLVFYIVRIILNLARHERNVFHKTYLDRRIDYDTEKVLYSQPPSDVDTMGERIAREQREDELLEEIKGIDKRMGSKNYPYYEKLIRVIAEHGGIRAAERLTGIPKTSIHRSVKKIREHLNNPPKNHP